MQNLVFNSTNRRPSYREWYEARKKAKATANTPQYPYLDQLKAVQKCQTQCEEEKAAIRKRRKKGGNKGLLWLAAGLGLGLVIAGSGQNTFDTTPLGMIPMVADHIILRRIGFFCYGVINTQHTLTLFNSPNQPLDHAPEILLREFALGQKATDLIMTVSLV